MQHGPEVSLPRTPADALKLWDAGQKVPAFRVTSEGAAQSHIWQAAFELIRGEPEGYVPPAQMPLSYGEQETARQLVTAMCGHGYAGMVQIQLNGGGEPIFVQRPTVLPAGLVINDGANPGSLS